MYRILYFIPLVVLLILSMIRVEPKWMQYVSVEKVQQLNRIVMERRILFYNAETGDLGFVDSEASRDSINNPRAKEIIAHLCDSMLIKEIIVEHGNATTNFVCNYDEGANTFNCLVIANNSRGFALINETKFFSRWQYRKLTDSVFWHASSINRPQNFFETLFY